MLNFQKTNRQILYLIIILFIFSVACTSRDSSPTQTPSVDDNAPQPAGHTHEHEGHIISEASADIEREFDIIHTKVVSDGDDLVFEQEVQGEAGATAPNPVGELAGAPVYSYVWPTSLDSSTVGFEAEQGILALALTVHPDFDDTPLYDEDGDGDNTNDGGEWHAHWIVLEEDDACGKGSLKVKDIPDGTQPQMPDTWPELPIFISSPAYDFSLENSQVLVRVPLSDIGADNSFNFDGVTSALRVSQQVHAPLLCITDVWDIASGDLSLPGESN
ncbi:MAG: hypothetical protein AAF490_31105 [Chloroflexota bacterium]